MLRRPPVTIEEGQYSSHQTAPRKGRGYAADKAFQNTVLYHGTAKNADDLHRAHYTDSLFNTYRALGWLPQYDHRPFLWPAHSHYRMPRLSEPPWYKANEFRSWLGREFVPWDGDYISSYAFNVRAEDSPDQISEYEITRRLRPHTYRIIYPKSKPRIDYQPGRLNIFLDHNNIVRGLYYF